MFAIPVPVQMSPQSVHVSMIVHFKYSLTATNTLHFTLYTLFTDVSTGGTAWSHPMSPYLAPTPAPWSPLPGPPHLTATYSGLYLPGMGVPPPRC